MQSVERYLVRETDRQVLLLDPPFRRSENHPGYIQGYPAGVRENGGQYTHAALWVAQAVARLGDGQGAVRLLQMLNPVERARTPEEVGRYQGEPYVIAADVYGSQGRVGKCGWSWYTGSAGLFYRIWIEEVLGFQLRGDRLSLEPQLPPDWPEYTLIYRHGRTEYEITVKSPVTGMEESLEVDGRQQKGRTFKLNDDGARHSARLQLGHTTEDAAGPDGKTKRETSRRVTSLQPAERVSALRSESDR